MKFSRKLPQSSHVSKQGIHVSKKQQQSRYNEQELLAFSAKNYIEFGKIMNVTENRCSYRHCDIVCCHKFDNKINGILHIGYLRDTSSWEKDLRLESLK